jgi:hypothetical protein
LRHRLARTVREVLDRPAGEPHHGYRS